MIICAILGKHPKSIRTIINSNGELSTHKQHSQKQQSPTTAQQQSHRQINKQPTNNM